MRDMWTCACTTGLLRERLPRSTVVRALPSTLQFAMSYIQLHADDLDVNLLSIDPEEPHTVSFHRNWKFVWCIRCGSQLGQAEMPNVDLINESQTQHDHFPSSGGRKMSENTSPPSTALEHHSTHQHSEVERLEQINSILFRNVKLDKHRLTALDNVFSLHRLETKVSADILALISITGCFKIVLRDFRAREPKLMLTILGWDSLVFSSIAPSQLTRLSYRALMPSVRLIYNHISPEVPVHPLTPTEMLEMDAFSIFEIATLLEARNSLLPPLISHLGTQSISYLHYIPPEQ